MILPKVRDPRFITIRRGGLLTDSDHHLLALWAAACAEHVLPLFEAVQPADSRPRRAIDQARAWVRGEAKMLQARAGGRCELRRETAARRSQIRGVCGRSGSGGGARRRPRARAAAYAIKAVRAAAPKGKGDRAGRLECQWQREHLPAAIRELVLDDQRLR